MTRGPTEEVGGLRREHLLANLDDTMAFDKKHVAVRYEIKGLYRKEITELPEDALLPKPLSGELRVKDAERMAGRSRWSNRGGGV